MLEEETERRKSLEAKARSSPNQRVPLSAESLGQLETSAHARRGQAWSEPFLLSADSVSPEASD